jgi:transmembrane sensor
MQPGKDKKNIDNLIVGYLKGELDIDQVNELVNWIKLHNSNKRYFDEYCEIWITSKALSDNTRYNYSKGFLKFRQKIKSIGHNRFSWQITDYYKELFKYAAIFIIAFSLGGLLFYMSGKKQVGMPKFGFNEIIVPRGARAQFSLSDGTKVTLNAGSKLKYNNRYGFEDREVQLEGEGYFKVAKDRKRAFIVNTSHVSVKALGTEFNVKAYPGEKTIETTLVEGFVEVKQRNKSKSSEVMILQPNQKLTFYKDVATKVEKPEQSPGKTKEKLQPIKEKVNAIHKLVTENIDVTPVISWKENRWIIEKQSLAQLAVELERKFDVRMHFESERLKTFRFTGTLVDEPIEQVLQVISISAPINYKFNGKDVTLYENANFEEIYHNLYREQDE